MPASRTKFKILSQMITILWYLEILCGVSFLSLFLASANFRTQIVVMFPVSFSQTNIMSIKAVNTNIADARLDSYAGFLVFHLESSWQNVALMTVVYTICIGIVIFITYKIKQIFKNFETDKNFVKSNLNHLRVIAAIILVIPIMQFVFTLIANKFFQTNLAIGKFVTLSPSLNYALLFTSITLFAAIEIFKLGIELEEENKLTV
ncbi:DUF2975 domain-containing protein [Pedobacter sp. KBS0701]|uniref:DUF2975 domain-containing protein n=1 Tax=Pedobacter sp. KBS0701 TaxID=2578106 RepID=UPI00110E679D|nr:DUF2975 domain-containing protein [Pedobacter sp. KBS0701]QDW24728.1 DUF2975 domain-containing protein [Pedobacter sp. KBS0701]